MQLTNCNNWMHELVINETHNMLAGFSISTYLHSHVMIRFPFNRAANNKNVTTQNKNQEMNF